VGNINDMANVGILTDQVEWGMCLVSLTEGLIIKDDRVGRVPSLREGEMSPRDQRHFERSSTVLVDCGIYLLFILETPLFAGGVG
jgi:hypothetical protein